MACKTPAMILQELTVQQRCSAPVYNLIHQMQGTHENEFHYEVEVLGIRAKGKGRSKKEAKQETAKNALNLLNKYEGKCATYLNQEKNDFQLPQVINYIGVLGDTCLLHNLPAPRYVPISAVGPSHAMEFTYECHMGTLRTRSTSSTKRQAKQNTAKEMMDRIKDILPRSSDFVPSNNSLAITEDEVIERYDLANSINLINLGVKVEDYNVMFKNLLLDKGISIDDLQTHTLENLERIVELLELTYTLEDVTITGEKFITFILNIKAEFPCCIMGQSLNIEEAKQRAIARAFELMETIIT